MKKLLTILTFLSTFTLLWAQNNVITYKASHRLDEISVGDIQKGHYGFLGAHFGWDVNIVDHSFENGVGTITFSKNITTLVDSAFYNCSGLTAITIPNSVTNIGRCVFYNCCSLDSVTIPSIVTKIQEATFFNCSNLTSVIIPNSVKEIGYHAFHGCSSLTSMVVEPENTVYDSRDNCNAIIETASNTLIYGCRNTVIPNSVVEIDNSAFSGCPGLISIVIPSSVIRVGVSAFCNCKNLTAITIPNSVTSIGSYAFNNCPSMISMVVEPENTVYDSRDNCNAIIETASNTLISGCKKTVIPNSVVKIGNEAFKECDNLKSITIPNSVTSIEYWAFYGCSGMQEVTCEATTPPIMGDKVFWAVPRNIPLYVPASSIPLYKAAEQWKDFDIQPILVDIDPIAPDTTNFTWNPIDSASLYKLHLYTDSTSSVGLDTTLLIKADSLHGGTMASSGFATVQRVHHVALDDIGSVVIITIDPTSGTSADNPYLVTVSTTSGERIEVHYGMTVLNGTKVIREDAGSFVLNDAILDAIENIYAPSFPSGIYDLHGRRYSMAVWESLPAGVYILRKDNRVVKVMK